MATPEGFEPSVRGLEDRYRPIGGASLVPRPGFDPGLPLFRRAHVPSVLSQRNLVLRVRIELTLPRYKAGGLPLTERSIVWCHMKELNPHPWSTKPVFCR